MSTTLYQQSIAAVSAEGYLFTETLDDANVSYVEGISLDTYESTIVGNSAGNSATGAYNTLIGYEAARSVTSGESLLALGYQTADSVSDSGTNSVIIGNRAGLAWTSGTQLVCLGHNAAQTCTSASYSVAVGCSALFSAESLLYATACGDAAGFAASGASSTFVGSRAGMYHDGSYSVCLGANAGYSCSGDESVFVGADSSGASVSWSGSRATVVGARSVEATVVSSDAVAIGADALAGDRGAALGADAEAGPGGVVLGSSVRASGSNCVVVLPGSAEGRVVEGDDVVNIADLLMASGAAEAREAVIDASSTLFTGTLDAPQLKTDGALTLSNVSPDGATFWRMKTEHHKDQNLLVFQSSGGAQCQFTDAFEASVLNFTGTHRCRFVGAEPPPGALVCSSGSYSDPVEVDDAVPAVRLSRTARDPTVFGVSAGLERGREYCIGHLAFPFTRGSGDHRLVVQTDGEGVVLVCDQNGPVIVGDLLCASDVPGYAMRQGDDVVRSYTVAKATSDAFGGAAPVALGPRMAPPAARVPGAAGDYAGAIIGCTYF